MPMFINTIWNIASANSMSSMITRRFLFMGGTSLSFTIIDERKRLWVE